MPWTVSSPAFVGDGFAVGGERRNRKEEKSEQMHAPLLHGWNPFEVEADILAELGAELQLQF